MLRLLACALLFTACPNKGPSGFSTATGVEDRWTLPLVGPLENGLLVTPVTIATRGPFLFALDPDAPISAVDGNLVKSLGMRASEGPPRYDETGIPQPRLYVELVSLEIGSLIIEKRRAIVVKANTFDSAGRRIHGVLGADVLASGVVFGFDRDAGVATLIDDTAFKPPANAVALPYQTLAKALPVSARRVVKATINGEAFELHLDLGATPSQLRATEWERAKLVTRSLEGAVVDEVGTIRKIDKASEPIAVTSGPASGRAVFIPYHDKRWADHELHGSLGLGFLASYKVIAQFSASTFHLLPRAPVDLAARVARWEQGALDKCTTAGCITVRVIDPLAGKPLEEGKPHPGVVLSLTREERAGGMPLEVVLEAKDTQLPLVIANMPAHVDRMLDQLPPEFVGATLTVVDVGPYPRDCPAQLKNGCVDKLAR